MIKVRVLILFLISFPILVVAAARLNDSAREPGPSGHAEAMLEGGDLKQKLSTLLPGVQLGELKPSPVAGLHQLMMGSDIVYISEDGNYLLSGNLFDIKTRTNLTEQDRGALYSGMLANMSEDKMIVIGPKTAKHTITVFTDVDCPYCAKLHEEVPELNKNGIKVRYLLYPRKGVGSQTYHRSVAVWCADDPVKAIGDAKSGTKLAMKTCDNPVSEHYELGRKMRVSGTPTIILDNGKLIGGYLPAQRLLAEF